MAHAARPPIEIGLNAAIVAVEDQQPLILVVSPRTRPGEPDGLPFGPFDPLAHRTFEMGLRAWVEEQTALKLGYVEQLYTFGDRGRHALPGDSGPHLVSVGYLALTRTEAASLGGAGARRRALAALVRILPVGGLARGPAGAPRRGAAAGAAALGARAGRRRPGRTRPLGRRERVRLAFGATARRWDEERVLDRYELLYEAGLVAEAVRDGRRVARRPLPPTAAPARRCASTIAASSPPRSRGCGRSSNTARSSSS